MSNENMEQFVAKWPEQQRNKGFENNPLRSLCLPTTDEFEFIKTTTASQAPLLKFLFLKSRLR